MRIGNGLTKVWIIDEEDQKLMASSIAKTLHISSIYDANGTLTACAIFIANMFIKSKITREEACEFIGIAYDRVLKNDFEHPINKETVKS